MAELKTKKAEASVENFIARIEDEQKRSDSAALVELFIEATGSMPMMWGESMIGFGSYYYESQKSSQKGEWMLTGFSPRKNAISVYIMPGMGKYPAFRKALGTHKASKGSCLYIKKLADIDMDVLTKLIKTSVADMKKKYPKHSK